MLPARRRADAELSLEIVDRSLEIRSSVDQVIQVQQRRIPIEAASSPRASGGLNLRRAAIFDSENRHVVGRGQAQGVFRNFAQHQIAGFLKRTLSAAAQGFTKSRLSEAFSGRIGILQDSVGEEKETIAG
jgi:hypothetical protein